MARERSPARVMHCHIRGSRSRGRQPKTWLDNVKEDMVVDQLNIKEAVARDRSSWRRATAATSSSAVS